ncbi:MepB family protein [Undibacterium parvum]|uniref:MepB domain containing protein n=1 Tax=Undibacterium parvum TaxID=401471 RepID=A0A3S9HHQ3_9BURK|nr:MepB family protein [Undibacterium parvum]AZP11637.1 MepB domain containing protein [Undibacterium parvum]
MLHAMPDLQLITQSLFDPNKFRYSAPQKEAESAEYAAASFTLNGKAIRFRLSKITPTKIGQFVTLWKRIGQGTIQPFDVDDRLDYALIACRHAENFGLFIFPKTCLLQQDIVAQNGQGGKRAIRVYPPWDKTFSRQAQRTQAWQLNYFLNLSGNTPIDMQRALKLFA